MKVIFSKHAEFEIVRRKLDRKIVLQIIETPQQKLDKGNLQVYQSKYFDKHRVKEMLLRVFVKESLKGLEVITAYKTSKINKYWKV